MSKCFILVGALDRDFYGEGELSCAQILGQLEVLQGLEFQVGRSTAQPSQA